MKKVFETPAIEIFRMQVSEELTLSDNGFENIFVDGVATFKAKTSVDDWSN